MTKNIPIPLCHTVRCHWHLDDVFPAKGKHVVEGKVSAPQWERAGDGRTWNWPSEARKGKEKGSMVEGEEKRQKGGEDYL